VRKRSLGRGLSELISGPAGPDSRSIVEIPIHRVSPNPDQPRLEVDSDRLEELTLSIEAHGVLQPIIVRQMGEDYQIIAGERRWRAAQRAGLEHVPCILHEASDQESLELALIENLQREDLNALEAARGYRRLVTEHGLTQEQLAGLIGKSRSAIANTLRLLELPAAVQEGIRTGEISEGHGRALLALAGDPDRLAQAYERTRQQGLTVREVEELVRAAATDSGADRRPSEPKPAARMDPNLREAQERIQDVLAAKVGIKANRRGGGKIEISFSNEEELQRLLELLSLLG
jgi:ParB family chromosome partitioning protein